MLTETERALRSAEVIHDFLKKRDEEEKQKLMQQFQPLIDEVKLLKENQVEETLAVIGKVPTQPIPAFSTESWNCTAPLRSKRRKQRRRNLCSRCGECDHIPSQCRFLDAKPSAI